MTHRKAGPNIRQVQNESQAPAFEIQRLTEFNGNRIGRIASNGVLAEYSVPTVNSQPLGIAAGADGALWFTEFAANQIGRITTQGLITEYTVPTSGGRADSRAPVTKLSRLSALRLS